MLFLNSENTKGTCEGGCKTSSPKKQNRGGGDKKNVYFQGFAARRLLFLKCFLGIRGSCTVELRGKSAQCASASFGQAAFFSKKLAVKDKNPFHKNAASGAFYGTHLFYHGKEARDWFAHQSERSIEEERRYRDACNEKVAAYFQAESATREDQTSEWAGASRLGGGEGDQSRFGRKGRFVGSCRRAVRITHQTAVCGFVCRAACVLCFANIAGRCFAYF